MDSAVAFIASGQAAAVVLGIVFLEGVLLVTRTLKGAPNTAPPGRWASPLLAGASLVAALWCAQVGAPPEFVGVALTVAGLAHLAGYRQRWFS